MKICFVILMLLICTRKLSGTNNHNQKLNQYLDRRAILLYDKINEQIRNTRESNINSTVEPIIQGSYIHSKELTTNIHIFTFFNKTFFAINDELFVATFKSEIDMEFYGNFTGNIGTRFFKTFEFHNTGFIAVGGQDETSIYALTMNRRTPKLVQTIFTPVNSDAIFFVNGGNLFLASTINHGQLMGLITFYQWLGSYFDQVDSTYTSGPNFLASFPFKKSEIIVVAQSVTNKPKIYSAVYEFKNKSVKKIHYINTSKPTHMNIFFINGYPHILIYEEAKTQRYFKWNGYEMVLIKMFHWEQKVDNSMVVYSNTTPLIIQPQLDKILVYKPQKEDIGLERTKGYLTNYSVILDINKGENENGNITFIAGLNEDNIINIYAMSFKVQAEMEKQEDEALPKCFNNLEQKVYDRREKLNQMKNAWSQVQNAEKDTSKSRKRQASSSDLTDVTTIENNLENIKDRLDKVKPFIINSGASNLDTVHVNGRTIIKGNLLTKNVTAKNLNIKDVNSKQWFPEHWLKYKETQTIIGPTKMHKLTTKILVLKDDTIFKNLLMNQGNQKLSGNFKIENISATRMFASKINDIDVENIYVKSNPMVIKGLKTFDNVFAKRAQVGSINENTDDIIFRLQNASSKSHAQFAPEVHIEDLEVDSIDNITWTKFEDSLFKIGENNTIEGNLITSDIVSRQLTVEYINGINSNYLMTKSSDQVINSAIEFDNINAFDIECGTINDIDITNTASIDQNGIIVKGPVRIAEVYVKNDLVLIGPINQSFFVNGTDHVWGTNESDFIQRYLGKVLIRGNLHVQDLSLLTNATLSINGSEYTGDVLKDYWTKNTDQEIPVHFEATNGVSTPNLKTRFLNTIPIDNFALNHKTSKLMGPLFFENVTVKENVFFGKGGHNNSIDLQKLALQGVTKYGGKYQINGKKVFKNTLKTKYLQTNELNGEKIGKSRISPGTKAYKKLMVKGDLISNIIRAKAINGIDIRYYKENIAHLETPQNITDAVLGNITVENMYVGSINGHSIVDYQEKLEKILKEKQIKTVHIKGNVTMNQVYNVKTINSNDVTDFFKPSGLRNKSETDYIGDIRFTGYVKLANLRARHINGINFPELTSRLLYKKSNQSVSGIFTFQNLNTVHLYTEKINDKNVENLIDTSLRATQEIIAPKGIVLQNVLFEKSLTATKMLPCDINTAVTNIKYPESHEWNRVEITGNVKLLDENCVLIRILEKSVKTGKKNVILAPVTVNSHILTNQVRTFGKLNDIDLTELITDAVLSDSSEEQIITGRKTFTHNIEATTVTVLENSDIPTVNNIYIPELYKRIIRKETVHNITILGKKTFFAGFQADRLFSDKISGIKPENIVNLANLSRIPNALFDSLAIKKDLNVKFINSYDLDYILNNRLLVNTSEMQIINATYFFNELEVRDNLTTPSINNIEMRNVIFDLEKQIITAPKYFWQNITIYGNMSNGYLNGVNISEAYDNALVHGRDEVINGSITILKPVKLEGNITTQSINGYPIEDIREIIEHSSTKEEEGFILNATEKIKNIILKALPAVQHMPNEFMYIERSENLQLKILNAIDARVTVIKDYALIHVLSEESHMKCNLPKGCKCPVQHTVEITPHLSVSYFLNKGQQRIYSYDDDTMTIHLTTNSISSDTHCRTSQSKVFNEMSTLVWSTSPTKNITGSFNLYPSYFSGYISGAEFFTLNDATYAIIARYYDPVADTHDLDCTVIKFGDDKTTALEIQKIPTSGVWTLYLLHTAQGVTLVIGNVAKQPYTEIYRFQENLQKFELLRTMAYGCTKAVGVVLGTDSLIILANDKAPLQVLKYDSYFDNYYYYQMFALYEPVVGISVFYVGGFGISDAYLCVVTEVNYNIYSFQYIDGWKLESTGTIRGLRNLIPVKLDNQLYLFAPSKEESSLLTIVKHGAGET